MKGLFARLAQVVFLLVIIGLTHKHLVLGRKGALGSGQHVAFTNPVDGLFLGLLFLLGLFLGGRRYGLDDHFWSVTLFGRLLLLLGLRRRSGGYGGRRLFLLELVQYRCIHQAYLGLLLGLAQCCQVVLGNVFGGAAA